MVKTLGVFIFFLTTFFLNSCSSTSYSSLPYIPYKSGSGTLKYDSPGSLYASNGSLSNLYSDIKAHRVGDVVFVQVSESVNAIESIAEQTQRSSSFSNAISSFFGINPKTLGNLGASASGSDNLKSQGQINQSGSFTTTIAANVIKVFPNGNMLIEGHKVIYLNDVARVLTLRGIIRPEDIASNNTIQSSQIANLEILYQGKGYLVDGGRPGWLARFLEKILPF